LESSTIDFIFVCRQPYNQYYSAASIASQKKNEQ